MFAENLSALMKRIGCRNAELARVSGCDPSLISRFRNGERVPPTNNESVAKLAGGLLVFDCQYSQTDKLPIGEFASYQAMLDEVGAVYDVNEFDHLGENTYRLAMKSIELIRKFFFSEMYDNESNQFTSNNNDDELTGFSNKLTDVMNAIEISNIELAKSMNVDPSLISKYRTGSRSPKTNREMTVKLCKKLFSTAVEQGNINKLTEYLPIDVMNESGSQQQLQQFIRWMCGMSNKEDEERAVGQFLETFSSYHVTMTVECGDDGLSKVLSGLTYSKQNEYEGENGLREAVKRFLLEGIQHSKDKGPEKFFLFSNQNMKWMVSDKDFLMQWMVLMGENLKRGSNITIVHNIERNTAEMFAAIRGWIPLYMLGMIKPYYCNFSDNHFAHTLFIAKGRAAIHGVQLVGCEKFGYFDYHTSENRVSSYCSSFERLVRTASPLVDIVFERERIEELKECEPVYTLQEFADLVIICDENRVAVIKTVEPEIGFVFVEPRMVEILKNYIDNSIC